MSAIAGMHGYLPTTSLVYNHVGAASFASMRRNKDSYTLGGGLYNRVTQNYPASNWDLASPMGKVRHTVVHSVAGLAQSAVWAPVGAMASLCAAFLYVMGQKAKSSQILVEFYIPILFVLGTTEMFANLVAIQMFFMGVRSALLP